MLDAIRDTRLADPDSWRRVVQNAPLADRDYLTDLHSLISDMAGGSKTGTSGLVTRNAFIYNYRTGACIYYDLGRGASGP